mgnify:FL=1
MNEQLLRMQWLHDLVRLLLEDIFGLDMASRFGGSVHFFIYDVIKIFILLGTLIFSISWIQSYFPPERTRKIIGRFTGLKANIIGALLGTLTPFCSCSSIPLFIGFTGAGLPLGATFSFLISSPLVDLASVILLASIFSWPIALAYVAVGIVLAVMGGALITRLNMERHVEHFVFSNRMADMPEQALTTRERAAFCRDQVIDITRRVWLYILIGVGIGAAIHNWIPESFISALLGQDKWYSVLVATVVGIPMYADIFGTLPIAEALVSRGIGLGTALAFMMAVTALSLPSLIMLRKVVRPPLLATFFGIVATGIILIGYLFNSVSHWLV